MSPEKTIAILIKAQDNASAVIKQAAANVKSSADDVATANEKLKSVGSSMASIGSTLTKDVTLPIAGLAAISGKMAYDFDNYMELLHTSAGIPQSAIQSLSDKVLALAGTTGQAPDALAQGLYHVASAGNGIWNTSQQLDILKVAAEGANLGLANLDDTTYALTSAMASGIKGASDPTAMMGVLSAIVGAGDMKMQDLNGALSTGILSTAATYGISIQSVGAALATLTDNGEHADEAATRLRMTLALMSSPSSVAAKQLSALGLTAEDAKNATDGMNSVFAKSGLTTTKLADDLRQPNGITVAVKDLKEHLEAAGLSADEADAMLSKAFGGGRTDAALLTLLQNTGRLDDKFGAINQGAGKMQSKLTDLNNTPNQKLRDAWASIQASLIILGNQVLPVVASGLKQFAQLVGPIVDWFNKLDPVSKSVIGWLITALAVGGPVLAGLGNVVTGIGLMKDAVSVVGTTATVVFGSISAGAVMGGIAVAGALADIALVAAAVNQVISAINTMNQANDAAAAADSMRVTLHDSLKKVLDNPGNYSSSLVAHDKAVWAQQFPGQKYALGTNFSADSFIAGENGPELITGAKGSKVYTNAETKKMLGGSGSGLTINGGLHIHNNLDEQRLLANIGWRLARA